LIVDQIETTILKRTAVGFICPKTRVSNDPLYFGIRIWIDPAFEITAFSVFAYTITTPEKRFVLFEFYPYVVADPSPGEAKIRVLTEVTLASGDDPSTIQTREHALAMKITRPLRGDSKEWSIVHVHNRKCPRQNSMSLAR
jgi:hypothetical protein